MDEIILSPEKNTESEEIMLSEPIIPEDGVEIIIETPDDEDLINEDLVNEDGSHSNIELVPAEIDDDKKEDDRILVQDELPGAPGASFYIELDENSAKDKPEEKKEEKKPKDHWDWAFHGLDKFIDWANDRYKQIPRHSGRDLAGLERAISYLEKLYSEVRKAMRVDFDGLLDSDKIEKICSELESGMSNLSEQIEKIESSKKNKKKANDEGNFVKNAGVAKTLGIVATIPLIILNCAQVCINGSVSSGHDIRHIYDQLCKKYKFNEREKVELLCLINEMGYELNIYDRGMYVNEDVDITSEDNPELQANYPGA